MGMSLGVVSVADCSPFYSSVVLLSLSCVSLSCVSPAVTMRHCLGGTRVHEFLNFYSFAELSGVFSVSLAVPMRECLGEHSCTSFSFSIALLS